MLQNLHIKNVVLIDEIDISFEEGLNILTGETGAGKSIIIGSLSIGLGGKFNKDLLRDDTKDGLVELLFYVEQPWIIAALEQMDIGIGEEHELLISRRLSPTGRTVNRINDCTVTTAKLQEISAMLMDLHAQHEQQTLLKADKHLEILDRFGGDTISKIKENVKAFYLHYTQILSDIEVNSMDEAEKNKRMDFLLYEIQEIESSMLVEGEEESLQKKYKKAVHSKEIISTASEIYEVTGYDSRQSAAEQIGHAVSKLSRLAELDFDLNELYSVLQNVDGMLNDFNRGLKGYMEEMTFDEQEFADMEARLDVIHNLQSKYGDTIEDIMHSCESFKDEYQKLVSYEEMMQAFYSDLNETGKKLETACKNLHNQRVAFANKLCEQISEALVELNFEAVKFDMQFETLDHFTSNGTDRAYFMISTNVGEKIRPLYDVASGGELSRVMLAIKSCFANEDDIPTLLFDEIDVGISGRTAQSVAKKLSVIAKKHQVLCITHLPQIAAMADVHYLIEKSVLNDKTITSISQLDYDASVNEIARLLGGATITDNTIAAANEMKGLSKEAN